jgi:hypothetical protein
MSTIAKRRLSVSTWSLHRTLGRPAITGPEQATPPAAPSAGLPLIELPAKLAEAGLHTLEICHFHLPSREPAYLAELRSALDEAEIELWSLLIDGGDLAEPNHHERDAAWIVSWLPVAAALGAQNARVSGGKQAPSPAAVERSAKHMQALADLAASYGVRLMTENWQNLLSNPTVVLDMLERLDGRVGLCADFGNWSGPYKYDDLAQIFPLADSCHAKCHFDAKGQPDSADFIRCLELTRVADFTGPYTLIYDGPGDDEFAGLHLERELVTPYL